MACGTLTRVSPTSRGRRPKKKPAGPWRSRRDEDAPFAAILREVGHELAEAGDALDAELTVSALAGSWWDLELVDADPEAEFGERLVAHAAGRRNSRPALALLRVVAELGTPAQREAASRGADALAADGVPDPTWADDLRTVRHTGSWAYGDVFGDQTSVLLAFDRPGRPHGAMVLVDHTLGGIAKDAFIVDDLGAALGEMRAMASDLLWVRELTAAEASALLVPAFAATTPAGNSRSMRISAMPARSSLPGCACFRSRRRSCRADRRIPSRSPRSSSPRTPGRATPTPSRPARTSSHG